MRGCQKHLKNIYFCPKSSHSFPTLPLQFCLFALNRRSVTTVGSAMTISWTHLWGQFSPYRLGSVSSCDCKSHNHWTSCQLWHGCNPVSDNCELLVTLATFQPWVITVSPPFGQKWLQSGTHFDKERKSWLTVSLERDIHNNSLLSLTMGRISLQSPCLKNTLCKTGSCLCAWLDLSLCWHLF